MLIGRDLDNGFVMVWIEHVTEWVHLHEAVRSKHSEQVVVGHPYARVQIDQGWVVLTYIHRVQGLGQHVDWLKPYKFT